MKYELHMPAVATQSCSSPRPINREWEQWVDINPLRLSNRVFRAMSSIKSMIISCPSNMEEEVHKLMVQSNVKNHWASIQDKCMTTFVGLGLQICSLILYLCTYCTYVCRLFQIYLCVCQQIIVKNQ